MKIRYLVLIFALFAGKVCAAEDDDQMSLGIVRGLIYESEIKEKEAEKEPKRFSPKFSGRLIYDVTVNDEYQSTDRKDEYLDTRSRGRFTSSFNFAKNWSVNSFLRHERSSQISELQRRNQLPNGGGDRTFENEGLHVEELNLTYDGKKHAFVVGKFNLNFGTAWRFNRGIWTYTIADNYRQREKIGANGIYRIGDSKTTGRYELSYAVFFNDSKYMDNSIITGRDSVHKSDGIPGDTRSLQSYVSALDVSFDFSEAEKLSYHFAYLNLGVNDRNSKVTPASHIADQKSWVAGMNYKVPVRENFILDALAEYAASKNFGGDSSAREDYLTANIIARLYQNWNVTLGYAKKHRAVNTVSSYDGNLSEISFGYEFQKSRFFDKLLFQFGYENQRQDFSTSLETRNSLGAIVRYQKNF